MTNLTPQYRAFHREAVLAWNASRSYRRAIASMRLGYSLLDRLEALELKRHPRAAKLVWRQRSPEDIARDVSVL